jgi:hypothetical protein
MLQLHICALLANRLPWCLCPWLLLLLLYICADLWNLIYKLMQKLMQREERIKQREARKAARDAAKNTAAPQQPATAAAALPAATSRSTIAGASMPVINGKAPVVANRPNFVQPQAAVSTMQPQDAPLAGPVQIDEKELQSTVDQLAQVGPSALAQWAKIEKQDAAVVGGPDAKGVIAAADQLAAAASKIADDAAAAAAAVGIDPRTIDGSSEGLTRVEVEPDRTSTQKGQHDVKGPKQKGQHDSDGEGKQRGQHDVKPPKQEDHHDNRDGDKHVKGPKQEEKRDSKDDDRQKEQPKVSSPRSKEGKSAAAGRGRFFKLRRMLGLE